ncbi:uncharacterized protein LOC121288847 [Carcharodon carcharias]|uniref:uncharacterized protein LOC121288847 n=1 Tax=Carcharodon carcharias TaxID=13397 RepID=UPI001B7E852E|nr:uncharacterized protein LOC121288847 [Carcharodon carcharias]
MAIGCVGGRGEKRRLGRVGPRPSGFSQYQSVKEARLHRNIFLIGPPFNLPRAGGRSRSLTSNPEAQASVIRAGPWLPWRRPLRSLPPPRSCPGRVCRRPRGMLGVVVSTCVVAEANPEERNSIPRRTPRRPWPNGRTGTGERGRERRRGNQPDQRDSYNLNTENRPRAFTFFKANIRLACSLFQHFHHSFQHHWTSQSTIQPTKSSLCLKLKMIDEKKPAPKKGVKKVLKKLARKGRQEAVKVEEGELLHLHYKVMKQVHPETGISSKAMSIMNSFVNDIFECIVGEASPPAHYNKRSTISSREIPTAVCLLLPRELAKHDVSEGTKGGDQVHQLQVKLCK